METVQEKTASGFEQIAGKYLTFFLEEEEYGLEILKVREIIGMMDITPVPRTPDIDGEEVQDAPPFGTSVDTDYILGIGKSAERVKLLLDIDQVLSVEEVGDVQTLVRGDV